MLLKDKSSECRVRIERTSTTVNIVTYDDVGIQESFICVPIAAWDRGMRELYEMKT